MTGRKDPEPYNWDGRLVPALATRGNLLGEAIILLGFMAPLVEKHGNDFLKAEYQAFLLRAIPLGTVRKL